jgi:hypothetical protein
MDDVFIFDFWGEWEVAETGDSLEFGSGELGFNLDFKGDNSNKLMLHKPSFFWIQLDSFGVNSIPENRRDISIPFGKTSNSLEKKSTYCSNALDT